MTQSFHAAALADPDDRENNPSCNETFDGLLAKRLHRRHFLKGGVSALTVASFGPLALAACGSDDGQPPVPVAAVKETTLGFTAVPKDLADRVTVAAGYTATVLYATGDSIDPAVADYRNDGSDGNFLRRSGDHHDGMHYFGLAADGRTAMRAAPIARSCASITRTSPAPCSTCIRTARPTRRAALAPRAKR